MRTPFFQTFNPGSQFMGMLLILIFNVLVWGGVGSLLVKFIWGIDIMSDGTALDNLADPNNRSAYQLLMLCNHAGFILAALMFTYFVSVEKHHYLLMQYKPKIGYILAAIVMVVVSWPVVDWLVEINQDLVRSEFFGTLGESMHEMEEVAKSKFDAMQAGTSVGNLVLNIILIALLPAIGEELVFRAIIQKLFARWTKNIHWGVWIAAAVFSFFHFQFEGFFARMMLGAMFGYLLVWSGTIWVPIIVHFVNNAFTLTIHWLVSNGTIPETIEGYSSAIQLTVLVVAALLLGIIVYLYRRKSRWSTIEYEYMKY